MSLQKVEGYSNLRKDSSSGGVLNIDRSSYEAHKNAKMHAMRKQSDFEHTQKSVVELQAEINTMRDDLSDIKSILLTLLEKGK